MTNGRWYGSIILIKVSDGKYALSVKLGVLGLGGILMVYGIKPQSHRAHRERADGDDDYSGAMCCSVQVLVIR